MTIKNEMIETYETSRRLFEPANLGWILNLRVKNKTIGKYKPMVRQLLYALNYAYVAKYIRDDGQAPLSTVVMSTIAKGERKDFPLLRRALEEANILVCDNKYKKGEKAFHFTLGTAMDGVSWSRSKTPYTFTLPVPMNQPDKLNMKKIPQLTIDATILNPALYSTQLKRGWTDEERNVWEWYLTDNWDNDYIVAKTGRVYGDWSRTPRELRGTFLIDGKPVVEVDIRNAQPLMLACLYGDDDCKESWKYRALVESGIFYEHVMKVTGCSDRDAVKRAVMVFLCGKTKVPLIPQYFQDEFPILYGIIKAHQNKQWKSVAHILQNLESNIIVKRVCEEFPVVSMHDGVICPQDIAGDVESRTKELIKQEYGLNATVTVEDKRKALVPMMLAG
jgi:hypothetical protein